MEINDNDFDEIAELAYKGKEISDLAILPKKYIYLRLFFLYDFYLKGKCGKEESIKIKNEIKKEYKEIIEEYKRWMECYKEYTDNRIRSALLMAQLEKTTDKDKMIELCLKIIGNCVNDQGLYERNIGKIQ